MSDLNVNLPTPLNANNNARAVQTAEQHPAHSLSWLEDAEHGIKVPVTAISQADSPDGTPNEPLKVYRTMGPGSIPEQGLAPGAPSGLPHVVTQKPMKHVAHASKMMAARRCAVARRPSSGREASRCPCARNPVNG